MCLLLCARHAYVSFHIDEPSYMYLYIYVHIQYMQTTIDMLQLYDMRLHESDG